VEISDGTSQTANSWAGRADSASNSGLTLVILILRSEYKPAGR